MLKLDSVNKYFGGLRAIVDFSMTVEAGELVGLIGPNGAGKTTVFNLITGVYSPTSGSIEFDGADIAGKEPHIINRMGIARTFQNIRVFPNLSVLENVMIAFSSRLNYGLPAAFARNRRFVAEEIRIEDEAMEFLGRLAMKHRAQELARNLPYGEQRRLEILRALATNPKILLLDEPAAGMNPREADDLRDLIKWIWKELDLTVILIEHQMRVVMGVCPRVRVLDFGQTIAEGRPDEIQNNPEVIKAYLGQGAATDASAD